jgi:hypothetical protein
MATNRKDQTMKTQTNNQINLNRILNRHNSKSAPTPFPVTIIASCVDSKCKMFLVLDSERGVYPVLPGDLRKV